MQKTLQRMKFPENKVIYIQYVFTKKPQKSEARKKNQPGKTNKQTTTTAAATAAAKATTSKKTTTKTATTKKLIPSQPNPFFQRIFHK